MTGSDIGGAKSSPRIGIIELQQLNHGVSELCRIALGTTDTVALFTRPAFVPQITAELGSDVQNVIFHICGRLEPNFTFLRKVKKYCDEHLDIVVANTLTSASFAFFHPTCKFAGFIYNMNWWLADPSSVKSYLKKLLRPKGVLFPDPIYNALTGALLRRAIVRNLDAAFVEYPPFVDYATEDCGLEKPVYFLPNKAFRELPATETSHETVRFVVTGQIHDIRRDYDYVLNAVQQIPQQLYSKFSLTLLGRTKGRYGRRIGEMCDELARRGMQIDYYSAYVPAPEFERRMREADIVIAPIRSSFDSHTVVETFTYTKGTGSFADALRFGKPSLVPDFYNVTSDLKECFVKYSSPENLCELICAYATDRDAIDGIKAKARAHMRTLSIGVMQRRFREIVASLV